MLMLTSKAHKTFKIILGYIFFNLAAFCFFLPAEVLSETKNDNVPSFAVYNLPVVAARTSLHSFSQ